MEQIKRLCYYEAVMNNIRKIIFGILSCFLLFGCFQKKVISEADANEKTPVIDSLPSSRWQQTDERIAVVFGYGYTDSSFYDNVLSVFSDNYGLDSEGGLILPLSFPSDFNYEGVLGRISSLPDILSEKNIQALIIVGAPESTHRALALLQDRSEIDEKYRFPVYSLFPQDDILGIEAGSHVVIDFAQFGSGHTMGEEVGLQHLDLVPEIILSVIKNASNFPENASSSSLLNFLKKTLGANWKVDLKIDPETGLRSKNHFTIALIENNGSDESVVSGMSIINR